MKKSLLISISLLVISFGIWIVLDNGNYHLWGFNVAPMQQSIVKKVVVFLSVIIGVILGSVYRHLTLLQKEKVESKNWSAIATEVNASIDFKIALIGAPFVFLALIKTAHGMDLSGLVLFGIEHGFISPIVIKQFLAKQKK